MTGKWQKYFSSRFLINGIHFNFLFSLPQKREKNIFVSLFISQETEKVIFSLATFYFFFLFSLPKMAKPFPAGQCLAESRRDSWCQLFVETYCQVPILHTNALNWLNGAFFEEKGTAFSCSPLKQKGIFERRISNGFSFKCYDDKKC